MTVLADIGLGSNLGDRLAHLQAAVDGFASAEGVTVVGVSDVYESLPVGGPPQGDYLNAVVRVRTSLDPLGLLGVARRLEVEASRDRDERWGPRTLDVDILRFDEVVLDGPDLVLPHPRLAERAFVLLPLADVDPSFRLPDGRTPADAARLLGQEIWRFEGRLRVAGE